VKVSVLGSGSRGNAILAVAGNTRILVDAGFSAKALENRLGLLGLLAEEIDGIVITHDHGDHTRGAGIFSRRHGTPVFLTDLTRDACGTLFRGSEDLRTYRAGFPFTVGSMEVEPFLTAHDARDPVAVSVRDMDSGIKLGVATDLGRPTAQVRHALSHCDFLVLEANHDLGLLHQGPYPASVRNRIASSHGHLSNEAAAQLAVELLHPVWRRWFWPISLPNATDRNLRKLLWLEHCGRQAMKGCYWWRNRTHPQNSWMWRGYTDGWVQISLI
jgi:phosphoribosyl 1,2-cyclic phosphodiesterase